MKSEIIAVGSEMLTPFRQDTNSLYLTEKLNELGVTVAFKTIVGDRRKDLVNAIGAALSRVDIVAIMGGLGPTEDDLTREAVAETLSLTLRRNPAQVAALAARAATWRVPMPANNLKQADVLEGATLLPNPNGSAPGQWLDTTWQGYRKLADARSRPAQRVPPALRRRVPAPPARSSPAAPHRQAHLARGHDSRVPGRQAAGPHLHHLLRRRNHHPRPTPETSSSPCSAPNPTPPPPSSAWTSWPAASKKPSKTGSTPPTTNLPSLWNRSSSTISACANPPSPSPKAAPAA